MKLALGTALLGAALLCAEPAGAQTMSPRTAPQPGQWSVTPALGADFNASGDFNKSKTGFFSGSISGFTGTASATISSQKFSDVYDTPIMGGVSVGYGLSNHGEVFGGFSYEHASGKQATIGTVSVAGTVNGTAVAGSSPISGKADDLDQYNFEVGYRHFFETGTAWLPYVSGSVGVAHVSGIKVDLSVSGVDLGKLSLYDGSTIAVLGLGAGVSYALAPGAAIGIETGLRYNSGLSGNSGASTVTADADRLTIPLLATGRFTF